MTPKWKTRGRKRKPASQGKEDNEDNVEKSLPGRKKRNVKGTPAYQAGAH